MELVTLHRCAVQHWVARVAAVRSDQWGGPTPCEQWSVRDLVNHVVAEELWAPPLLSGKTIQEVGSQFDADVLGADPHGTARMAADDAMAIVEEMVPAGGASSAVLRRGGHGGVCASTQRRPPDSWLGPWCSNWRGRLDGS